MLNTGNLQLKNLTVIAPDRLTSVGSCSLDNSSNWVLDAGAHVLCSASVTVTTADIEAGETNYAVQVVATSALGGNISSFKEVTITPKQVPQLSVTQVTCESSQAMPGMAIVN